MKPTIPIFLLCLCGAVPQFSAAQSESTSSKSTDDADGGSENESPPPHLPEDDTEVDEVFSEEDVADTVEPSPAEEEAPPIEEKPAPEKEVAQKPAPERESPSIEQNPYGGGAEPAEPDDNPPWVEAAPPEESPEPEEESTTYLPPPPPAPSGSPVTNSPCEAVSCGGRGACVMKNGEPTCACYPGFIPDSINGLTCLPEQRSSRPAPKTWDMNTYYEGLKQAMLPYDISPKLVEYRATVDSGKGTPGSLSAYLHRSFKRTQNFATVELSFGIAALAGALSMHMIYAGFPDRDGFLAGAIILDLGGAGLIGLGSAMTALSVGRAKKLDRFERQYHRSSGRIALRSPGLLVNREGGGFCFGFSFL